MKCIVIFVDGIWNFLEDDSIINVLIMVRVVKFVVGDME